MTNAKNNETKQEQELKSCPVAAALAPVRQLQKGEQVSALIFEGGGTKGAAYAGVVKALDAAGLINGGARPRGRGALPRVRLTRRGVGVGAARPLLGVASEPAAMHASSPRPVAATSRINSPSIITIDLILKGHK